MRPAISDPTHLGTLVTQYVAMAQSEPGVVFQSMRHDPAIAVNNYMANVEVLAPHEAQFAHLPGISWSQIQQGLELGHALLYKDAIVDREVKQAALVRPLLSEQSQLRSLALSSLQAHVAAENLDGKVVAEIRRGTGPADGAGDLLVMAKIFLDNPHLQQRSPVTDRHLERMQFVGSTLQVLLQPAGAHPQPKAGPGEETIERDWLWSLLVLLDDQVWKAGAIVWGRRVNNHLRALGSRDLPGRPRKTEEAPMTQEDQAPQQESSEG